MLNSYAFEIDMWPQIDVLYKRAEILDSFYLLYAIWASFSETFIITVLWLLIPPHLVWKATKYFSYF